MTMQREHEVKAFLILSDCWFGDHRSKLNEKKSILEGWYQILKYKTLTLGPESEP